MRFILPLLILCAAFPAFAQEAAQAPAAEQEATQPTTKPDWDAIGRPASDDTKDMMDRFVYFNADATDVNVALDNPVLSPVEIREWIRANLSGVFTLNGQTFDSQIIRNRFNFTPRGYADYVTALRNSKIDTYLKENRYKLSALILEDPIIVAKGIRKSVDKDKKEIATHVWQLETRIYLAYLDYANEVPEVLQNKNDPALDTNTFSFDLKVELVRIPMQENGNLVAINTLLFNN